MAGEGELTAPPEGRETTGDQENQNLLQRSVDPDGETNKERREHIRHLQKEAFQLANYYFVFQGVIFTAFYNMPSHIKCQYHWVPFTLSFLAGFLNICALSTIACKYKSTLDDIDKNATRGARRESLENGTRDDQTAVAGGGNRGEPIAVKCARNWRLAYVVGCMSLFIGFFVVTLIGCWNITCGGGSGSADTPPPGAN